MAVTAAIGGYGVERLILGGAATERAEKVGTGRKDSKIIEEKKN